MIILMYNFAMNNPYLYINYTIYLKKNSFQQNSDFMDTLYV